MQDIEIIMKEREDVKSYSPIRCCNLYHAEKEVVEKESRQLTRHYFIVISDMFIHFLVKRWTDHGE